jgi:chromosome segregation protein
VYLSNLDILGFKSFAQRIDLKFDAGVTAIVGPNGCGKTNIVDAIRWALGEQRYSTLRSDKMEDVIFNGTKHRKPLGLAEVSLTIQNTKGILPTEYSEVTITRRVFRSGESEYLLNKAPCRLKDILDLFMDTGMGADAYSVIELKMVESILSDKTDERRKLFEEAAGVTKYKFRRKAAYRKLEEVQKDLLRVNDIVKEVQKTVGSLERQAKKAEQYNDVSTRLRAQEIDLLEREFAHVHSKLQPLEEQHRIASTDRQSIDAKLKEQEDQLDGLRSELSGIERSLIEAQRTVAAKLESLHRLEEKILVGTERRNSLEENIARYENERKDLGQQEVKLGEQIAQLQSRRGELELEVAGLEKVYQVSIQEQQSAAASFETQKGLVQGLNAGVLDLAHTIVTRRGHQERTKAKIDNLRGRIERSKEEIDLYTSDIQKSEERVADLTTQDRELRRRFVAAEMALFEFERARKELQEEIGELQKRSLEIDSEINRRTEKIDFLQGLIESNEGYSEAVRYVLGDARWKQKAFVTVADIVRAPDKYRVAIEAALADAAAYVVADKAEDALAAIEILKKEDKGKATFVCLERVPVVRRKAKGRPRGILVWASELAECESRYRPLLTFLLDRVAVVESIQDAHAILKQVSGVRCVTVDGQIVASSGLVRGGSKRLDEGGRISKEAHIVQLGQEVHQFRDEHDKLTIVLEEKKRKLLAHDPASHASTVKSIEKEMTTIEVQIAQVVFEKKRANDGIERNQHEQQTLEHEIVELEGEHQKVTAELQVQEDEKRKQEELTVRSTRELEILEAAFVEKSRLANEGEISVIRAKGELQNLDREIQRDNDSLTEITLHMQRRGQEITQAREEIQQLASDLEQRQQDILEERAGYTSLEQNRSEIDHTYGIKRNELHQIELRLKDERRQHDDAVSVAHDLEMKISELRANAEHLRLRAKEEFELDMALKSYPDDEFVDFARLRDDVRALKDRIRILGAINFAAFDEFTTESERLSFMSQQRDDLLEAEKTLVSTIEEINATAQRIFLDTFGRIRDNFIMIFKELFMEGDECDLKLEEGGDPLECNIEIIAKPRGKRPTSIDLLSGGEKTLTAISLLFAIYLVKPSPFCILDEVDAPLDDSNIDRYTRILKKFSNNTQFIVVTHNKRTMEAASALYGVTMEEEGISKIVTVRFNDEARVRSATLAGAE